MVSRWTRPLRLRSRPGVFAARRCIACTRYGVDGAPAPLFRGVRRFADGVLAANRLGVRGYRV